MRGKIRVLLDDKTEYIAVVETLGSKINQLNTQIRRDEENARNLQNNLQEMYHTLTSDLKARDQMLETLKKLKTVKRQKDIDVEVHNPSEKLNLENPDIELCTTEEEWNALEEADKIRKLREEERKKDAETSN
jgi:superfamily I DNA and RNA helicase